MILVITSNIYKTADQNWVLHSEYQLIWTHKCSLLINSFIKSQSSYCPLIWMFCNWKSMKKVNRIQERYSRSMTNNCELSYLELLDLTNDLTPHQRYLHSLMTEVYKCLNGLSPDIINDVLAISKYHCSTRHYNLLS